MSSTDLRATEDGPDGPGVGGAAVTPRRRSLIIAAVVLACSVATAGGLLAGSRLAEDDPAATPGEASVDAGFARDMQIHHAQAVQMSSLVRDRTDSTEIRTLALDIMLTQQQQIGQMHAWLDTWGLPQASPGPALQWMGSGDEAGTAGHSDESETGTRMAGMATPAQLADLRSSSGRDAEVLFLELMIDHHRAGIEMVRAAATQATQPAVRSLAQKMVTAQASEIEAMRSLLADRATE